MDTFYINMDIKDSTLLWRCNELEMVEAFAKEWYIVSEWVRYVKLKNNVSIQVTGQFGDEWRMIYNGSEIQLKMLVQELLSALMQYVDVPFYNSTQNKSLVSCKTSKTQKTQKTNTALKRNKTLFRIGISKGVNESPKEGDIKRAVEIEANCTIDKVCIEKKEFKLKDLPVTQSKGQAFKEMLDVKSLMKTVSESHFTKLNVFYVFTLEDNSLLTKTVPVKVKTNAKMGKTMKSYIFENIEKYVAFIKKCRESDILYSNAYGPVYRPKKRSKLCFINANDVYGDVVNTAAKVLFKL
jgi:hypothetical protein